MLTNDVLLFTRILGIDDILAKDYLGHFEEGYYKHWTQDLRTGDPKAGNPYKDPKF